jgi:flavin reductase (DIM6/NTAB) family NADH-FMN oxidoreductase RutF
MIHITSGEVSKLDRVPRLTLINSITGYKPANLIGTINDTGQTNLAIISSVVHLGSDPALIGFVMRPLIGERHTMENILQTNYYTINHINEDIAERAHFTSADLARDISEFDKCHLTPQYLDGFVAPYVAESKIKLGMSLAQKIDITINGCILVVGRLEHIFMDDDYISPEYAVDLNEAGTICISGLDTYHKVEKFASFSYARPENIPDFAI